MIRIDSKLLEHLNAAAKASPRKRKNHNFHKENDDLIQRLLNAMEPGTYIRPHKHENPDKREVFFVLKGSFAVVEFDETGAVEDKTILKPSEGVWAAEIAAGKYHTIIPLEKDSVAYEIKDGPYDPVTDKDFAPWAPAEDSDDGESWNKQLLEKINIEAR
jgi:cupin fold WbuC family metalloprotein